MADVKFQPSPVQERLFLLGLGLATGMKFYVADGMNLVLIDLTGTLGVSLDQASWILTVYSSALFLGVPVSGWLGGHFGPKRCLIGSIALFAAASAGCAVAFDLQTMLLFRFFQGLAGSTLITAWRAASTRSCHVRSGASTWPRFRSCSTCRARRDWSSAATSPMP